VSWTVAAFRDAWRDYRRYFRELSITSALLALPMAVIAFLRWPAPPPEHGLSLLSGFELEVAAASINALTPAAVAVLAADLRAGGAGGWRAAWAKAVGRIDRVITGRWVVSSFFLVVTLLAFALARALLRHHDAPLWKGLAGAIVIGPVLVALASFALVPLVTAVGGLGGSDALVEIGRILRREPRSTLATLLLAQLLAYLPILILILFLVWRFDGWAYVGLASRGYEIAVLPFVTLVALSVYERGRAAG
jgi:hypothetical protein